MTPIPEPAARKPNKVFQALWLALLTAIAVLEVVGLVRRQPGDTLSEYVRAKTRSPLMRAGVAGLLGWLLYHWPVANGGPLGAPDVVSAAVGAIIGVLSLRVRR